MGGSRALVTLRLPNGVVAYINAVEVAKDFILQVAPGSVPGDVAAEELEQRAITAASAVLAHAAVNVVSGHAEHCLGMGTWRAQHALSGAELRALRSIRRKANLAKHNWQGAGSGPGPAPSDPLPGPGAGPLDVPVEGGSTASGAPQSCGTEDDGTASSLSYAGAAGHSGPPPKEDGGRHRHEGQRLRGLLPEARAADGRLQEGLREALADPGGQHPRGPRREGLERHGGDRGFRHPAAGAVFHGEARHPGAHPGAHARARAADLLLCEGAGEAHERPVHGLHGRHEPQGGHHAVLRRDAHRRDVEDDDELGELQQHADERVHSLEKPGIVEAKGTGTVTSRPLRASRGVQTMPKSITLGQRADVPSGDAPGATTLVHAPPLECEKTRCQRAPDCSDHDWQVVARWRAKKARVGKRASAWQWARQRWQANANEWEHRQEEKKRDAFKAAAGQAAALHIQRMARGMFARRLVRERRRQTPEEPRKPSGAAQPAAGRKRHADSAGASADPAEEEILRAAIEEVEALRKEAPELGILEAAVAKHAPQCGICRTGMAVGQVRKVVNCGHCVDARGRHSGKIKKGVFALLCTTRRCDAGMCMQCVQRHLDEDEDQGTVGDRLR